MAKFGDIRESVINEKERIDNDLQQMWESLQSLKKSVEQDATLLQKSDFSDLLQHIVTDLFALSSTADIVLLQQTLQLQENLTAADLDTIIQQFISVKLEYTANKSLHLTDTSLEKYKQLVEHKSAMDALLLKITQTPTPEVEQPVSKEKQSPTAENTVPVTETPDLEVIKAQQSLIDWQKPVVSPETNQGNTSEESNKSWWERAKESSFGLAYIVGAENITRFKDWAWEKWDDLKEWIGWKKKDKKEENNVASTTPESSTASPESPQPSVDINKNLTETERLLRNTYIKQSILDTTTVPVVIDYKTDKDVLIQKWSPDKVLFDVDTQSIVLGGAKVQLKFPQFTMDVWGIDATVTKVDIRSITASGNDFLIEAKGTGSAGFIEQTKDISTTLSKEQFYGLLQPYLESGKVNYDTSLEFNGQKVPVKLDVAWTIEPENTPSWNESSENFVSYKQEIYNSYPEQEKKYLDDISKHSADMYTQAVTWLDKERLPTLLQEYDASLLSWLDWGTLAILGRQFGKVSDLTDDTALQKLWNMANDVLGTIIDFLSKGEDTPVIKWIAKILKRPFEKLQWLIPNGNEQKQNDLRSAVEKQLKEDPSIKSDLEKVVKQFSLVRFYFAEKKAILQEEWIDAEAFAKLSLPAAANFLQNQSLLDASLSTKMTLWLESNKVSVVLENLIKSTDPESDLSAERWKIQFNYKTQELESRWMWTKINVSKDGKRYQIEWLDMIFTNLQSAVWLANLSNRMISQIGWLSTVTSKVENYFVYEGLVLQQGLYIDSRGLNTDRLVSGWAFKDNIDGWEFDYGVNYAKYLNDRVKLF